VSPGPVRQVGHVMNLPVSLTIRGRHAADDRGRAAWARVMAELREVDAVFGTYRPDSFVSRLGRGEIALEACPPEMAEVLAWVSWPSGSPGARSGSAGPGPPARPCSTPPGW
jgi:FAD:protein FMN transferase